MLMDFLESKQDIIFLAISLDIFDNLQNIKGNT